MINIVRELTGVKFVQPGPCTLQPFDIVYFLKHIHFFLYSVDMVVTVQQTHTFIFILLKLSFMCDYYSDYNYMEATYKLFRVTIQG